MFASRFKRQLRLGLILLWVGMLLGCGSPASTRTHPVTDTPIPAPTDMSITNCGDLQKFFGDGDEGKIETTPTILDDGSQTYGYVKDQLVITGNPNDIGDILSNSAQLTEIGANAAKFQIEIGSGEVIRVYGLASGSDVLAVATAFNDSVEEGQYAVAEPNYILSYPQYAETQGLPGSSGVEGGAGGGFAMGPTPEPTLDLQPFLDQWALNDEVNDAANWEVDAAYLPGSSKMDSGKHVNLLIFDSSPLNTGSYYDGGLCVHALLGGPGEQANLADNHGLFVASLAGATATEGNIHLIQILKATDDGQLLGDLVTLLSAIDIYHQEIGSQRPQGVAHTVINLSLGFKFNPAVQENQAFIESVRKAILWSARAREDEAQEFGDVIETLEPPVYRVSLPVKSLGAYFDMLEKSGYVIVAAAGNDGLELPQTPASFTKVIGVEAVTYKLGGRACFSNRGDISAPGGGPTGSNPPGDDKAATVLTQDVLDNAATLCLAAMHIASCLDQSFCDDGVTGHMWINKQDTFGYWAGTSFATPLVSGVAVSAAEYGISHNHALTPAQVRQAVYCTATAFTSDLWKYDPQSGAESVGMVNPNLVGECVTAVP